MNNWKTEIKLHMRAGAVSTFRQSDLKVSPDAIRRAANPLCKPRYQGGKLHRTTDTATGVTCLNCRETMRARK